MSQISFRSAGRYSAVICLAWTVSIATNDLKVCILQDSVSLNGFYCDYEEFII